MEVKKFIICSVIVLSGALGVLIARNPVHAALFLVDIIWDSCSLHNVGRNLLAAVQVVVYAGAIVILFFSSSCSSVLTKPKTSGIEPISGQRPLTIIIGTSILGLVLTTLLISVNGPTGTLAPAPEPTTNTKTLVKRYSPITYSQLNLLRFYSQLLLLEQFL